MPEEDPQKLPPQDAIRAFTEFDLKPEYRVERDIARNQIDHTIDWCLENEAELPPHVSLVRPKEGVVQVSLKTDEQEENPQASFVILQRDDLVVQFGKRGSNSDIAVTMTRGYLGELPNTYKTRELQFMNNGLVRLATSEEEEIQEHNVFMYRPISPYTGSPAHIEDIRFESETLDQTVRDIGLPEQACAPDPNKPDLPSDDEIYVALHSGIDSKDVLTNEANFPIEAKAPNGEKSNLPPPLWALVRTDSFKRWFGNWEDNPEASSRIVDENGEPKLFYHGTQREFDEFNPNAPSATEDIGINNRAIFLTDNLSQAKGYANYLRQAAMETIDLFKGQLASQISEPNTDQLIEAWNSFMSAVATGKYVEKTETGSVEATIEIDGREAVLRSLRDELVIYFDGTLPTTDNQLELVESGKYLMPPALVRPRRVVSCFIKSKSPQIETSTDWDFDRSFESGLSKSGDSVLVEVASNAGNIQRVPSQTMLAVKNSNQIMIVDSENLNQS